MKKFILIVVLGILVLVSGIYIYGTSSNIEYKIQDLRIQNQDSSSWQNSDLELHTICRELQKIEVMGVIIFGIGIVITISGIFFSWLDYKVKNRKNNN